MKRLLSIVFAAILTVLALSSCNKSDKGKSYEIACNFDASFGTTSLIVFECDDVGTKLTSHTIDDIEEGGKYTYTSIPEATRIKIYYEQESFLGTTVKWVQQVFLLRDKGKTEIVLDDSTLLGSKEP